MTAPSHPPLRKDAQRNHDAILDAARELFAESADVAMYEIARHAGVGQATLYRHFPDRRAVALALFGEQIDRLERLADEHAGDPDAFFVLLRGIVDAQARFHGLVDCLRDSSGEKPAEMELFKQRFVVLIRTTLRDAKAAGALRRDVTLEDVFLVVAMVEGALSKADGPSGRAAAATRALTLTLDGLTARRAI
jgi:AcrR family transcriptional regulator